MAKQPSSRDETAGFEWQRFKVCDLCGALNHIGRGDCFICGWRGHFSTGPDAVAQANTRRRSPAAAESRLSGQSQVLQAVSPPPNLLAPRPRRFFRGFVRGFSAPFCLISRLLRLGRP
jgi:hypothetical protein